MLKKIFTYIGLTIVGVIFITYFVFVSILKKKGDSTMICKEIQVVILDSLDNRFVSRNEVKNILSQSEFSPLNKNVRDIDVACLEEILNNRSAIKRSDVAMMRNGILRVSVTQRRPILRIDTPEGGFYVDDTEYIFPLVNTFTSYVPVVTGNIPVSLETGYRGKVESQERQWMNSMLKFAAYISRDEFLNAQIQQIYIERNGDIVLYTRAGDQSIQLGSLENVDYKFRKLSAFYRDIVPIEGWHKYSDVNLKYSNQIVCTLRDTKKKKI